MTDDYNKFVRKAVAGDKHAFGELYKIFLNKIYRFTYYLVHDEFLAEDITQNTFLKAWNSLPSFSEKKGTFQAYLYTIARNLVIDNQRKKYEVQLDPEITGKIESNEDLVEDIWNQDSMKKVHIALSGLSEPDRELIVLRYFEDMQFDEIAEVLGKESGALRVKVHRLLKQLKENLEGKI